MLSEVKTGRHQLSYCNLYRMLTVSYSPGVYWTSLPVKPVQVTSSTVGVFYNECSGESDTVLCRFIVFCSIISLICDNTLGWKLFPLKHYSCNSIDNKEVTHYSGLILVVASCFQRTGSAHDVQVLYLLVSGEMKNFHSINI